MFSSTYNKHEVANPNKIDIKALASLISMKSNCFTQKPTPRRTATVSNRLCHWLNSIINQLELESCLFDNNQMIFICRLEQFHFPKNDYSRKPTINDIKFTVHII